MLLPAAASTPVAAWLRRAREPNGGRRLDVHAEESSNDLRAVFVQREAEGMTGAAFGYALRIRPALHARGMLAKLT
jgi:hypothetical protein